MSSVPISTRTFEVVIRLSPHREALARPTTRTQQSTPREKDCDYDAWVFAPESIPDLKPPDPSNVPPDCRKSGGIPLVALERVSVRWNRYQEYLGAFLEGEKGCRELGRRLFGTLSEGLQRLFGEGLGKAAAGRRVRLWWSSETPELEDMPWELMAYDHAKLPPPQFVFVRGTPPDAPSFTPEVDGPLRLALIHDPEAGAAPTALMAAIQSVAHKSLLQVIHYQDGPRQALQRAAAEGVELLHIVADGFVSLSYDGILYLHQPQRKELHPELGAAELTSTLSGSRVRLIALSEACSGDPDMITIGGQVVPSVYRAFACLGATRMPVPTMVAPLGPLRQGDVQGFWSGFYQGLSETLSVHKAMAAGCGTRLLPFALFLRQRSSRLFRRGGGSRGSESGGLELVSAGSSGLNSDVVEVTVPIRTEAPAAMAAQIDLSRDLIENVTELGERTGGLSPAIAEFLEREGRRHSEMKQRLDPYLQSAGEEAE